MWYLLMAHQQESFLPFSSRQSLSCCLSSVAKRSTPKAHGPLYSPSEPRGPFPHFRTAWSSSFPLRTLWFSYSLQNRVAPYFLQSRMVYSLFTSEPRGLPSLCLPCLGLNPSAHLPLQPHFRLLLQSVTPASIPLFFQLYWAAIVSPGRCGPVAWSQTSPSSHAGPVTRGSCFPVPSWVEFGPIPLAQSMATAT